MNLRDLIATCPIREIIGNSSVDVHGLNYDSRLVNQNDVFFALRGIVSDGHNYISSAIANGASVVFCEEMLLNTDTVTTVLVDNSRRAMALVASEFYGNPTKDMKTVGITGTNGKTTISYLLEAVLSQAGLLPAVIGTINYRFGLDLRQAPHTTPEALDLMKQVSDFRRNGAQSLIMEVSSHALDQHRTDGVHFEVGLFTNLTPEHLDYHNDMESYFQSKCRLFLSLLSRDTGRAVINIDDGYGLRLASMIPEAITCGRHRNADIFPTAITASLSGIKGQVQTPVGVVNVDSQLIGEFNVENLLCAIGAAVALGLSSTDIELGLRKVTGIPGRLEVVGNTLGAKILVDYAHTSDALKRVIDALQKLTPKRILTVFGCGGDRDRSKRPAMAETVALGSDITIATSDNPRTEDPHQILNDVCTGFQRVDIRELSQDEARIGGGKGYVIISDRREALKFAVSLLRPGDLLLVAGKGHEDYQILPTGRIHFDDCEELRSALERRGLQ